MNEQLPGAPEAPRLHPDRNFNTIAARGTDACSTLAALAFGAHCALLEPACGMRLLELLRSSDPAAVRARAAAGLAVRSTLSVDLEGRLAVAPLRSWIQETRNAPELCVVLNDPVGPYLCRPLQMGADIVVEQLGSLVSPVPCTAVIARTPATWERFREAVAALLAPSAAETPCVFDRRALGEHGEPLLLAGLRGLAATSQWRSDNALVMANYLAAHPAVAWVSYPGLAGDPANDAARRTLEHGFGPLVSFGLATPRLEDSADARLVPPGPVCTRVEPLDGEGRTFLVRAGDENPLDAVAELERFIAGR